MLGCCRFSCGTRLCLILTLVEPYENIYNLFSEILRDGGVVRNTVYQGVRSVGGIRIASAYLPLLHRVYEERKHPFWRLSRLGMSGYLVREYVGDKMAQCSSRLLLLSL